MSHRTWTIKFAQSTGGGRIALGLGLAALAQLLALFLAGAGHGWITPYFVSPALWVLIPVTLYIIRDNARFGMLAFGSMLAIALGADLLLINWTLDEWDAFLFYIQVADLVGLPIMGLWLCLWFFWQAMLIRSLIAQLDLNETNA